MECSYIFVSEIMKMCKEKKVYENTEKVAFYHNAVAVLAMPVFGVQAAESDIPVTEQPGVSPTHLRFP